IVTGASFVVIDGALKGGEETFTVSVLEGSYEYGLKKSRILGSLYSIPCNTEWSLRLVAVYNIAKGRFAYLVQSKVDLFLRIRVSLDDAEYQASSWPDMAQEYATWIDLLDNQVLLPFSFQFRAAVCAGRNS
ncbi:unnamed protein product, partial [Gongylonema pulchrum]|uniref:Wzt_C domain-containing protein n=1 Tax=Gongylonema pulchrum TaxID=637853 RepID=A0A183EVX3_9BILA